MELFRMTEVRFEVTCQWDEEAQLWYVLESNVPGLSAEAPSKPEMAKLLAVLIPQLVQLNQPERGRPSDEVPIELLYRETQTLKVHYQ
jgi:hypothetical protein